MTVKDMMDKLSAMVTANPSVADMEVDSEGCDCTESAEDVVIDNGRVTVSRSCAPPPPDEVLSDSAFALLQQIKIAEVKFDTTYSEWNTMQELRDRHFVQFRYTGYDIVAFINEKVLHTWRLTNDSIHHRCCCISVSSGCSVVYVAI